MSKKSTRFAEEDPRKLCLKLRWDNNHRNNCRRICRDDARHFQIWKRTYESYIDHLYSVFSDTIKPSKVSLYEFAEFAYSYSSGYISKFA